MLSLSLHGQLANEQESSLSPVLREVSHIAFPPFSSQFLNVWTIVMNSFQLGLFWGVLLANILGLCRGKGS